MTKKRPPSPDRDGPPAPVVDGELRSSDAGGLELAPAALRDLSRWLSADAIVVRLAMVTQGLELSLNAGESDDQRRMSIDVARGRLVVGASLADVERALFLAVQERAREQGAVVKSVALRLQGVRPRQVDMFVTVAAKQGFLAATVEIKGRVTIDDTFHARLSGVDVRGQGMLGSMVAVWMRPHLKRIEQGAYHISSVLPGSLEIQDVRLEVDERIQLVAMLGGSNLLLDKPAQGLAEGNVRGANADSRTAAHPPAKNTSLAKRKKLDIFIVDTGGNARARKVLDSHLALFQAFLADQNVQMLTRSQSEALLKQHPALVGADPILMVVDSERRTERTNKEKEYGFRFCLGTLAQDAACGRTLESMLRILADAADAESARVVAGVSPAPTDEALAEALQVVVDVVEFAART